MRPSNNREFYEYLVFLGAELKSRGLETLSRDIVGASRRAWTIPITEFLGESRIALRRVLAEENGILNQAEREDLEDVLRQLDAAVARR